MAEKKEEKKKVLISRNMILYSAVGIVVIAAFLVSGYFYIKYQQTKSLLAKPDTVAKQEIEQIVEKVGALIELPTTETPTVASVSDVNKLKNQQFFARAQNGDKVLIYKEAKKAYLYRPSTNKIVEVGPVNLSVPTTDTTAGTAATASGSVTPGVSATVTPLATRVVILNGTTTVGLTKTAENVITDADPTLSVIDRSNAVVQDYEKTTVIDVSGTHADIAKKVAGTLKATVGKLPAAEVKPEADILVILGKDFVK